jgi:hypothetical protein
MIGRAVFNLLAGGLRHPALRHKLASAERALLQIELAKRQQYPAGADKAPRRRW